jgi:DNA sulfur modification protein DndD
LSLRFSYAQFGYKHEYEVTRSWNKKGNSINEKLIVKRDGTYLLDMAEDRWQDFIEDLIPSGVANLFFFDGEKIQSLASDNLGGQILGEEIKRLLGLSVVEKLQLDLDVYLYRQRKDSSMPELSLKVEAAQKVRDAVEYEYLALRQDRSQTEAYLAHLRGKIDDLEQRISRESSGFGMARDALKNELTHIEAELDQTERLIHDMTAGLLPFALIPELCERLRSQLLAESEYQQWDASQKIMVPRIQSVRDNLSMGSILKKDGNVPEELIHRFSQQLNHLLDGLLEPPKKLVHMQLRHQISETERVQLLVWIDQAVTEVPHQFTLLGERLETLEQDRHNTEAKLRKVPDDEVLRPLMDELNQLHQKLGELQAISEQQDKKLASLNNHRQDAQRQLQKAYEDLRSGEELDKRLQLVTKVQGTLQGFLQRLTREKLARLEELMTKRFNEIIQKADLVQRIAIDPDQFRITVYDGQGKEIPKEGLSAGEKQMFAVATLWALRQLSGRPFPVVIDTPLGRLDREHRDSLVENYFPVISHQVILFSTDTEVDQNYFQALSPHISHAYHLTYNPERGATDFKQGYFWGGSPNAA